MDTHLKKMCRGARQALILLSNYPHVFVSSILLPIESLLTTAYLIKIEVLNQA